jgi:hypothetical protein
MIVLDFEMFKAIGDVRGIGYFKVLNCNHAVVNRNHYLKLDLQKKLYENR